MATRRIRNQSTAAPPIESLMISSQKDVLPELNTRLQREDSEGKPGRRDVVLLGHEKDMFRHQLHLGLDKADFKVLVADNSQDVLSLLSRRDAKKTVLVVQKEIPSRDDAKVRYDGFGLVDTAERIGVDVGSLRKIMISNNPGDRERALESGFDVYRSQPVDADTVVEDVKNLSRLTN